MIGRRRVGFRSFAVIATLVPFLAQALTGCSMALVKGPPTGPQPDPPPPLDCTTSTVLPFVDAVGGTLVTFGTGVQLATGASNGGSVQIPLVVVGLSAMVLLFYSSTTGFRLTSACREAKKRAAAMPARVVRRRGAAPAPLPPPPLRAPAEPMPPAPVPIVPQKADPESSTTE
jgi:hypothetical protein